MSEVIFIPSAVQSYVPPSNNTLHIWWDPVDGDDTNNGLFSSETPGTQNGPVQTPGRVWQIAGPFPLKRPVLIHAAGGATYDFSTAPVPDLSGSEKMMCLYADFDWDPRNNLVDVIATGAAGVGTDGNTCVLPAPVVENVYETLSMRFTSGLAAGQVRTVAQHPTTALTPTIIFNPAPAPDDTFEVFRSSAVITTSSTTQYVALANSGSGSLPNFNDNYSGLSFVNFDFLDTPSTKHIGQGLYLLFGVRFRGSQTLIFAGTSTIFAGVSSLINEGVLAKQFGLPQHLWAGWGVGVEQDNGNAINQQFAMPGSKSDMYMVAKGDWTAIGSSLIRGGSIQRINCFTYGAALHVTGPSSVLPFVYGANTRGNSVINFAITYQAGEIRLGNNVLLRHSGGGTALLLRGPGQLRISTTATGARAAGTTMDISRGFRVFTDGALNMCRPPADPSPNDIVVESLAAFNRSVLSASSGANSIRADATVPGSYIRRTA